MLFQKLDREKLGEIMLRSPLVSFHANHKKVQYTLQDYVLPSEGDLEGQFVRDLFVLTTDEIIEKWFGGKDNAIQIVMSLGK